MDDVDFERTLETQRVRLLRLLTGWFSVVVLLSVGPLALPLPFWFGSFLAGVLTRAELAAQYLVRASVCLQARDGLAIAEGASPFAGSAVRGSVDAVPSTRDLLRRMNALRRILEDLPRYARRMMVCEIAGEAFDFSRPVPARVIRDRLGKIGAQWIAARVERPPDKIENALGWFDMNSPPKLWGGRRTCYVSRPVS